MNTFQDLRQKLLELYLESVKRYPITEEDYSFCSFPQPGGDDGYSKRIDYFIDEIKDMDEDYQERFLSLLTVYYYASVISSKKEEEIEEKIEDYPYNEEMDTDEDSNDYSELDDEEEASDDEELLNLINEKDVDTVISELLIDDNRYLFDILSTIIATDVESLSSVTQERGKIEDFEEYALIDDLIDIDEEEPIEDDEEELFSTKDESVKEVYDKFHPNKELEIKNHKEYVFNDTKLGKFSVLTINSLADFIEKVTVAKQVFTKARYFELFIYNILSNTKITNEELFEKIYLFMIKYYYIKGLLQNANDKEALKDIKIKATSAVSYMPSTMMDIVYDFTDFDFYSMILGNNMLPKEKQDEIEKNVSLDFRKTYGIEGKWMEFNQNQEELIYKYCSTWNKKIIENQKKGNHIQIYYSINENDYYCIPRLCIISNENNELVEILGRSKENLVEFEMLKTLDIYSKKYANYENIKVDINLLNKLKEIERKIDNNEELTKEEIEFLFEIECEFPSPLLFRRDTRNKRIQAKSNIRKLFAKYFDCKEEEIAETEEELNENTKVALFEITTDEDNFPYPNLIAVYGNIVAGNITSSESLRNLQYVKEDLSIPCLKDKEYLQEQLLSKLNVVEENKTKRK